MTTLVRSLYLTCHSPNQKWQPSNGKHKKRAARPFFVGFKKLISLTRKTFKRHEFDLVIRTKKEKDLDVDKFYVMAYYDSHDDSLGDTPIEVYVHHNLTGEETFGDHQITNFLIEIYDAVVHEHKHQVQSKKRSYEEYTIHHRHPYDEYLSNSDEVDAYALSIAIEMLRVMSKDRAKRYMGRISVMSKMRTGPVFAIPMLRAYFFQFGHGTLLKRLSKKVYKHLDSIDSRYVFK